MNKFAAFSLLLVLLAVIAPCISAACASEQKGNREKNMDGKLPFDPTTAKDITPAAFKDILKVYKTPESNSSMPTYAVRGSECLSLGTSFGGSGVYSVIAADVNHDGKQELVYACSWGSGMHRTNIGLVEVGKRLVEYRAPDALLFDDEDIKLLSDNGRVTVSVKGKPFADIVFSTNSQKNKSLVLKKLK